MATLQDLLTVKRGDPELENIRIELKAQMKQARLQIIVEEGEIAYFSAPVADDHPDPENAARNGQTQAQLHRQQQANWLARYNEFEKRLKALPPEKSEGKGGAGSSQGSEG